MELTVLQMTGYRAAHATDETPFRCVVCEYLTRHATDSIIPHMVSAHNIPEGELSIDKDGTVFHTPILTKEPKTFN